MMSARIRGSSWWAGRRRRRAKYLMEQTFGTALKEGWHGLRDVATAREASTYVQDPKRPEKHGAQRALMMICDGLMGAHRVAAELQPRREGSASGRVGLRTMT
jgi:hypothetical protein